MRSFHPHVLLMLLVPLLAGCLGGAPDAPADAASASGTAEAPAGDGPGPAAPEAPLTEAEAGTPFEARGTSTFWSAGACEPVDHSCAGLTNGEDGRTDTPTRLVDATLEATWDALTPLTTSMRVQVLRGDAVVLELSGESPLMLDLGELPPAVYAVRVAPAGAAAGYTEESVEWVLRGVTAPSPDAASTRT